MVGLVGQVAAHDSARQVVAPQNPEPLLAEAGDDRNNGRGGEDANVEKSLTDEAGHVAIRDRGHEIPAYVAVDDVQRIRRAQEQDQRGENQFRLAPDLRSRKHPDGGGEARHGRLERDLLRVHLASSADPRPRLGPVLEQSYCTGERARQRAALGAADALRSLQGES